MRQPDLYRPIKLTTTLPEDIRAKLDLHLFSDLEGRIPKGAYQKFLIDRIAEYFNTRTLDLTPFSHAGGIVRGSPEAISILETLLTRKAANDNQS